MIMLKFSIRIYEDLIPLNMAMVIFWYNLALFLIVCPYGTVKQKFDFNLRSDHEKNFLWASRLWVGRRKEPILGYVLKNYNKKRIQEGKG